MLEKKRTSPWLVVGALGVVFGDLGTSPLYALPAVFGATKIQPSFESITGLISLIIWSVVVVVIIQYLWLIMKADNKGEGGTMALISLIRQTSLRAKAISFFSIVGLVGISLFYGDSVITPAISVLSAIEGIRPVLPQIASWVVPITVIILGLLFILQSRGTGTIGKFFGPVMLIWFLVSAVGGVTQVIAHPEILSALSPFTAASFIGHNPIVSFFAMTGVVLAITGVEALYADLGHFGRQAISKSWLFIVFPSLALTYLGQGALIAADPHAMSNVYFSLFPNYLQLPVIVIATLATVIASQAVIAGTFSLTRQAIQLGFAPRLRVQHTSTEESGQIYVPSVNWIVAFLVVLLVITFGTSAKLAVAFGTAVSGAILIDLILFFILMTVRKQSLIQVLLLPLAMINILFFVANVTKFIHGAWLPLTIALICFIILSTWYKGRQIISRERFEMEGSLHDFVAKLKSSSITRLPGQAVYIGHHAGNTPLALHDSVVQLHELHETVVVVTVNITDSAHIPSDEQIIFDGLGSKTDGISHVTLQFGYNDTPNVPLALEKAREENKEIDFDPHAASYFVSHGQPAIVQNERMATWRKRLYLFMDRNASDSTEFYKLPLDRTVEMSSFIKL